MKKMQIKFSFLVAIATIAITIADKAGAFTPKPLAPSAVDCYTRNLNGYSQPLLQNCNQAILDLTGQCLSTSPTTAIDPSECGSSGSYFCCAQLVKNTSCPIPVRPDHMSTSGYIVSQVYCRTQP
ncbi:hypothetical protein [Chitinophaga defluvii]|uniref:Uncharacterized protein n=1 Tax=Chitinophaga defluvii TaxID=3163343 RepID=A0ABV2TAY4_9BACT